MLSSARLTSRCMYKGKLKLKISMCRKMARDRYISRYFITNARCISPRNKQPRSNKIGHLRSWRGKIIFRIHEFSSPFPFHQKLPSIDSMTRCQTLRVHGEGPCSLVEDHDKVQSLGQKTPGNSAKAHEGTKLLSFSSGIPISGTQISWLCGVSFVWLHEKHSERTYSPTKIYHLFVNWRNNIFFSRKAPHFFLGSRCLGFFQEKRTQQVEHLYWVHQIFQEI